MKEKSATVLVGSNKAHVLIAEEACVADWVGVILVMDVTASLVVQMIIFVL